MVVFWQANTCAKFHCPSSTVTLFSGGGWIPPRSLPSEPVTLLYNPMTLSLKVLNTLLAPSLIGLGTWFINQSYHLLSLLAYHLLSLWSRLTHFLLFKYIHFLRTRLPRSPIIYRFPNSAPRERPEEDIHGGGVGGLVRGVGH